MAFAMHAFVPDTGASDQQVHVSVAWTFWDEVRFLIGSELLPGEGAAPKLRA